MTFLRLLPIERPADRALRLVFFVLAGLVLLLLAVWNPITTPGPIVCPSRLAFGIPCPFCGVTRGVALCLRGQPVEASTYNPLTVPIFVGGLGLMAVWALEFVGNVRVDVTLTRRGRRLLIACAYVIFFGGWAYMITFRREDDFATTWLAAAIRLFW